jgi:hypothetical protein
VCASPAPQCEGHMPRYYCEETSKLQPLATVFMSLVFQAV